MLISIDCPAGQKRPHDDGGGVDHFLAVPSKQNANAPNKERKKKKIAI